MTDPIADMLTRMRNALTVSKKEVRIPKSKLKFGLADVLKKDGWIKEVKEDDGDIVVVLKYENGKSMIKNLKRISKPGCRIYAKYKELPIVLDDLGVAIISTPNGLLTNKDARRKRVGGEILCEIY